jgi:predicted aspartyl protease
MTSEEEKYADFELFHPKDSTRHRVIRFEIGIGKVNSLYTVLPEEICHELGEPLGTFIQLINAKGASSEVELWAVGVRYKDRQYITPVIPSKTEETTLGYLALAQLGLANNLKSIKCFKDPVFNSLIYDHVFHIVESLYNTREALAVYHEVINQYNEDWIDILINNDNFLNKWDRSSFVCWFMSIYNYSLISAIISLFFGLYLQVAFVYRQALESLIAAYVADTHINHIENSDPLTRLNTVFEELQKSRFKEVVDRYFGDDKDLAKEIVSLWRELSSSFVHARGPLCTFSEVPSIKLGLPLIAYVDGDKKPLLLLNDCIRRFRKIFKTLFDKWTTTWGDGDYQRTL